MAAGNTTTQLDTVQRYWQKKWSNLPVEEYETPLANSKFLQEATIPKGQGGSAYFRRINHFSQTTALVTESAEATPETLSFETVEVPIKELTNSISIGHMANDVDPVDLIDWSFKEFVTWVGRSQHLIVANTMVNGFSESVFGTAHAFDGFQTIYAQGAPSFKGLTPGSIPTVADFVDATDRIRNARAPKHSTAQDKYVCVIDDSTLCDLMDQDPDLNTIVREHRDLTKAVEQNKMISFPYKGLVWVSMSEGWRTKLSSEGDGLTSTYSDTGKVHFSHVFGANSVGYVNHGSPALRKSPKFKVQDITITGIETTIGFRIPMNVVVLKDTWGINVAGTSNHDSVAVGG